MKLLNLILVFSFISFANISLSAQAATQVQNAKVAEFRKQMAEKDVVLIDVRTPREVAQGTIEGAINIPLNTLSGEVAKLDKTKKYLVFCRSGARSRRASMILARKGFEVYNLKGGILAWNRR